MQSWQPAPQANGLKSLQVLGTSHSSGQVTKFSVNWSQAPLELQVHPPQSVGQFAQFSPPTTSQVKSPHCAPGQSPGHVRLVSPNSHEPFWLQAQSFAQSLGQLKQFSPGSHTRFGHRKPGGGHSLTQPPSNDSPGSQEKLKLQFNASWQLQQFTLEGR